MSAYGYVVERVRRAQAAVARLERAVARDPQDASLQVNLAAQIKQARRAEEQFGQLAEANQIEVCRYRLVPEGEGGFGLLHVSRSLFEYQNLFSQVHDALQFGKKRNAIINPKSLAESHMEFGYSYSGSLGVALLVGSQRDLLGHSLDKSIETLFQVVEVSQEQDVRQVAQTLGIAVLKRAHDWSKANVAGGFAADVRWRRTDGRILGEMIPRRRMEAIADVISRTSDVQKITHRVRGILVGLDVKTGSFRLTVPRGTDYRGGLAIAFPRERPFVITRVYDAQITETLTTRYATEAVDKKYSLEWLREPEQEQTPLLP